MLGGPADSEGQRGGIKLPADIRHPQISRGRPPKPLGRVFCFFFFFFCPELRQYCERPKWKSNYSQICSNSLQLFPHIYVLYPSMYLFTLRCSACVSDPGVCFCLGSCTSVPMVAYLAEDGLYLRLSYYQYQIRRKREAVRRLSPEGLDDHQVLGRLAGARGDMGTKVKDSNIFSFVSNAACSLQCKSSPQKPTLPANLQNPLQAWVG